MKTLKLNEPTQRKTIGRWSGTLLVAAGMQVLALPHLNAQTKDKQITDSGITAVVEKGFKQEKGVVPDTVDVSTSQGIVTLSGSLDNLLAKERAVRIAESIRGVRGVIDQTIVTPVSRSDDEISRDITSALKQDPATQSSKVTVSVQDAVATLAGTVGFYGEKRLATRIAEGVRGVKAVQNNVTISYLTSPSDAQIASDIKSRLQWDIWINGDLVKAVVVNGNVTLTGTIGSAISKSRAEDDAWVNGVMSVDDKGVVVAPRTGTATHQEQDYAARSDSDIKKAILASLRLDPRVSAYAPDVTVEDGGVILGGNVGNLKAKTSAGEDAKDIVGVWRVDNLLQVKPTAQPTDAQIESQLKAALAWDPLIDGDTITVGVTKRIVHLSGSVDSSFDKSEAQDLASRIDGVLSVRNNLKAEPEFSYNNSSYWPYYTYGDWPYYSYYDGGLYNNQVLNYDYGMYEPPLYMTDDQIKKSIRDEFFWSPFVDNSDIKVSVTGGVATLTGTVGTRIGMGEIDSDAYQGGATNVIDQVKLKHHAWWWWW